MKTTIFTFLLSGAFLLPFKNFAQTPGLVVRPAGAAGPAVLDRNGDGYTYTTAAAFAADDVSGSEIKYKKVPAIIPEPIGDLLRGPAGRFSDIVKTVDGSGFYLYNDSTNLLFRIRIGGLISGSKGYSVLLDTDNKFGNTGAFADTNYLPATSGVNGNPGFELEVVLETNFRVAVYNVDGKANPVLIASYPVANYSQISLAATSNSNDPDYFYDFYVPNSVLGFTASTPIRAVATTVMSPSAAIGGPKSDIYGLSGTNYMADWTTAILGQPTFTLDSLTLPKSGVQAVCTAPPVITGTISPTSATVTGTWSKSVNSTIVNATITLFKGTTSIGSVSVANGGNWSIPVSGLLANELVTAKAQGSGESSCLASNAVRVTVCNAANLPETPVLGCTSGSKGITGSNLATGWTVHVDNITRNVLENNVTNAGGLFGANSGSSPNITWQFSGGCTTGAPLTSGSYKIYYTNNTTGCNSLPAFFCAAGNGGNSLAGALAAPLITAPANGVFTTATTTISGTSIVGVTLTLYINGISSATTTAATGGIFKFSNLVLQTGAQVYITAELNTGTVGTSYCASSTAIATVTCFTDLPLISVGNTNLLITSQAITGTSTESTGTLIRVYNSANTLVATTPVQSGGTWSTANAATTPAPITAAASTAYYAKAQNGACGTSGFGYTFNRRGNGYRPLWYLTSNTYRYRNLCCRNACGHYAGKHRRYLVC